MVLLTRVTYYSFMLFDFYSLKEMFLCLMKENYKLVAFIVALIFGSVFDVSWCCLGLGII